MSIVQGPAVSTAGASILANAVVTYSRQRHRIIYLRFVDRVIFPAHHKATQ